MEQASLNDSLSSIALYVSEVIQSAPELARSQGVNWSGLLPSFLNRWLNIGGREAHATDVLRDLFIILTFAIGAFFAVVVLFQTILSWRRIKKHLQVTKGGDQALESIAASDLPLFREFRHHLIEFPSRDGSGRMSKRRTVEAAEVFRESALAPGFVTSRFILALPGILTGLGVLGTFVGLALGLGSLDLKTTESIENGVKPLIQSFAAAFSSSVWGVMASLLFSAWEKVCEGFTISRIQKMQIRVDALYPRYVPEEAMSELERASRGTEEVLKGLAVAIGAEMQEAIGRLGTEIKEAVSTATAEGHGPLMEKSAEILSSALTAELGHLKTQIGSMANEFSGKFSGASDELMKAVQGFQPTVTQLSDTVGATQRTVADAVAKLDGQEAVIQQMTDAAANIRKAAETFGAMNETLSLSAKRNEDASKAQLSAADSNRDVAEQFLRIGEGLPEIQGTLGEAARVISSITGPILGLKEILDSLPTVVGENAEKMNQAASGRDEAMLKRTGELAQKVEAAAAQFSKVEGLAAKLESAAESLNTASNRLHQFGTNVKQAADVQLDASEASREAAAAGERAAAAFEPLPEAIQTLVDGLGAAGTSVRDGAESAKDSYQDLIALQKQWFEGAELGLNAMKDRLQSLMSAFGAQVDGQTQNLMKQWTEEVVKCLSSYSGQVDELQGSMEELQSAISKLRK